MGSFGESSQTARTRQNSSENINTTTTNDPWRPQQDYLGEIFRNAQSTFNNVSRNNYSGDHLADFRPEQLSMFNNMINYANSSPIASMMFGQGANLSNLGQGALGAGFAGLQDFRPNDTMGTINDASLYADNPFMDSMVDAATRDSYRGTYEDAIPGVQRNAALKGNTNSSRTGAKEAILARGHEDRRADVSAALRGDAYQRGIGHAQSGREMEMARLMGLTGTGLQAALGGAGSLGNSVDIMGQLFGFGNAGAGGLQAAEQQNLDNELARFGFGQDSPWGPLMNYYNILGANNWGGTSNTRGTTSGLTRGTSTSTSQASPASILGGILTGFGSLIPGRR